jgi:hypothetical protein
MGLFLGSLVLSVGLSVTKSMLFYYGSIVCLEIWYCDASSFSLLVQDCFSYWDVLCFLMNFELGFSSSVKNVNVILLEIALNL